MTRFCGDLPAVADLWSVTMAVATVVTIVSRHPADKRKKLDGDMRNFHAASAKFCKAEPSAT